MAQILWQTNENIHSQTPNLWYIYPHLVHLSGKRRWIYHIFIHIQHLGWWFQSLWSPNQPAINGFLQIPSMGLANSSTFTCYLLCMEHVPVVWAKIAQLTNLSHNLVYISFYPILTLLTTGSGLGEWLHFISSSTLSPILLNVTIILETMPPPEDRQASTKLRHGYFVELPWRCRGFGLRVRRSKSRIFISSRFMKAA